jgi:hypothetical protein
MTYSVDGIRVSLDDFMQNFQFFYKSDFELNEAMARHSANSRNYQRRWVERGKMIIIDERPPKYPDTDVAIGNSVSYSLGYWKSTALSLSQSYEWLLFGLNQRDRQSPENRLADATGNLKERLGANNGDNPCAKLFGGLENALKTLRESKIEFRSMGGPISLDGVTIANNPPLIGAVTNGKSITINSDGPFMANNGTLPVMGRPGMVATNVNHYGLNDIGTAAFILAHELGHRTGKLEDDSISAKDPEGAGGRNHQRVYEACFKD